MHMNFSEKDGQKFAYVQGLVDISSAALQVLQDMGIKLVRNKEQGGWESFYLPMSAAMKFVHIAGSPAIRGDLFLQAEAE